MYAPPMPLEQPPLMDRPGVRALRGARPQMTPEMQRMRDWAASQRAATAANARNGDFILNPAGSGAAPAGVGIPTRMPMPEGREDGPAKPGDRPTMPPVKPGMLPNKPMETPPPDKGRRLTGRRG